MLIRISCGCTFLAKSKFNLQFIFHGSAAFQHIVGRRAFLSALALIDLVEVAVIFACMSTGFSYIQVP